MSFTENLAELANEATEKTNLLVVSQPEVKKIKQNDQEYIISYIESLLRKPTGASKKNPFENPEPELVIAKDDDYSIILNKFPVIKNHFLLISNEFASQTDLLQPKDLEVVYKILDDNDNYLAFFNSGENSGASQAHKHIQFIPKPKGFRFFQDKVVRSSGSFIPSFKRKPLLADKKYAHFIAPLEPDLTEEDLAMIYINLVQNCLTVAKDHGGESKSYNLLITKDWIMAVPRSKERVSDVSINALGFAGMILVKSKEVYDKLDLIDIDEDILLKVGYPREYGKQGDDGDY